MQFQCTWIAVLNKTTSLWKALRISQLSFVFNLMLLWFMFNLMLSTYIVYMCMTALKHMFKTRTCQKGKADGILLAWQYFPLLAMSIITHTTETHFSLLEPYILRRFSVVCVFKCMCGILVIVGRREVKSKVCCAVVSWVAHLMHIER